MLAAIKASPFFLLSPRRCLAECYGLQVQCHILTSPSVPRSFLDPAAGCAWSTFAVDKAALDDRLELQGLGSGWCTIEYCGLLMRPRSNKVSSSLLAPTLLPFFFLFLPCFLLHAWSFLFVVPQYAIDQRLLSLLSLPPSFSHGFMCYITLYITLVSVLGIRRPSL